jgi:hypothetical protein
MKWMWLTTGLLLAIHGVASAQSASAQAETRPSGSANASSADTKADTKEEPGRRPVPTRQLRSPRSTKFAGSGPTIRSSVPSRR